MWDRTIFKSNARAHFQANYWPCVVVSLLLCLLVSLPNIGSIRKNIEHLIFICQSLDFTWLSDILYQVHISTTHMAFFAIHLSLIGYIVILLVGNPFQVSKSRFYLENRAHTIKFSRLSAGFSPNYGNVVLTQFLKDLFILLWTLLLIVPGIIRSLGYFAVPFLLSENPNLNYNRVLKLSLAMTDGYKWEIFVTYLSFLGWLILNILTLNLLRIFYVTPYMDATEAELYCFLREKALENGLTTQDELSGMKTAL